VRLQYLVRAQNRSGHRKSATEPIPQLTRSTLNAQRLTLNAQRFTYTAATAFLRGVLRRAAGFLASLTGVSGLPGSASWVFSRASSST